MTASTILFTTATSTKSAMLDEEVGSEPGRTRETECNSTTRTKERTASAIKPQSTLTIMKLFQTRQSSCANRSDFSNARWANSLTSNAPCPLPPPPIADNVLRCICRRSLLSSSSSPTSVSASLSVSL